MKIDNGTGGSRETSTGGPGSRPGRSAVDERGRESFNFFAELKRRNVYKVAVAYTVAGWALSQGIAQVLPVFDVPNWAIRLIVLLIIIGLPVALSLAWAFELTPEGIKRTDAADACWTTLTWPYLDLHCCHSRCVLDRLILSGSFQRGKQNGVARWNFEQIDRGVAVR